MSKFDLCASFDPVTDFLYIEVKKLFAKQISIIYQDRRLISNFVLLKFNFINMYNNLCETKNKKSYLLPFLLECSLFLLSKIVLDSPQGKISVLNLTTTHHMITAW